MKIPTIFEKKELKSDKLYYELKEMIINNKLEQGTPLSERKLCELLNASRTPVREALRKLYNEHFVELRPEYGAFVSRVTYEQVFQVYDIREMLEALAIRLFTQSVTNEQLKVIRKMHTDLKKAIAAKDYNGGLHIDLRFHNYIISESKNDQLHNILNSIFEHTMRIINLTKYTDEWAQESLKQHQLIIDCIIRKDSSKAEKEMRKHTRISKKHQLEQWLKNKQ